MLGAAIVLARPGQQKNVAERLHGRPRFEVLTALLREIEVQDVTLCAIVVLPKRR